MPQMLIIADDLTGAADCGVGCARHGLQAHVVLGDAGGGLSAEILAAEVLAVDADTRRLSPQLAAAETARLLRAFLRADDMIVYKKIDSTLRGNVGEELAAMLESRRELARTNERIVAVLAPAFPATGRTTVNGRQLVNGEAVGLIRKGEAGDLRTWPDILAILRDAGLRPALLRLELVRGDSARLRDAMREVARDADVLVCDAETDDDLRRIAESAMALGRGTVWAGSGGLARHLPLVAGLTRAQQGFRHQRSAVGPALFVVGSGSAVSRKQVEALGAASDTIVMRIPHEVLLSRKGLPQWQSYGLELEQVMNAGRDLAVMPDPDATLDAAQGPLLSMALAAMVAPLADMAGSLVVTGGETARAVFDAWRIDRLLLMGEVEAGLPFSVAAGWRRELPVLTKAGGFGEPETLLSCLKFLRELDPGDAAEPGTNKGSR